MDVSASLEKTGSAVEKDVVALGRSFRAYQCNLSQRSGIYTFLEELKRDAPVIDILVNNAGTILCKPAAEHTDEYWDTVIDTNLKAPFIVTRELGRDMVARGYGKIIFTASLLTFQGGITVPGYAASKGAIGSLVKAFANEWASKGVNVNAIAPDYIATDNTEALREDAERSKSILARIPAGRWGQADDFKGPTVFLASSASDYVHGTILTVGRWRLDGTVIFSEESWS